MNSIGEGRGHWRFQVDSTSQPDPNGGPADGFDAQLIELRAGLHARALFLTQDADAANDLVQEALERALLARQRFRTGTNLRAWLNTILKNAFIDARRRPKTQEWCELDETTYTPDELPPPGPSDLLSQDDIMKALSLLGPLDREMFMLTYDQGLSYRAISETLGISLNTVGTRLLRTRAKLRKLLAPVYETRRTAMIEGRSRQ